ncbi:hypothetical protein GN958_ATG03450 [Phytophthora infestans]|uniref:Uncharacterized protein n=1 Tax=Phytophthora infestans TaxID=4787 RepID=A0A8S9V9W6_PHYIN|nr:hypothetical protein GN958_ATG03450 [Phytophthora infestans]
MDWRQRIQPVLAILHDEVNDDYGDDEVAAVAGVCVAVAAGTEPPAKKQRGGSQPGKGQILTVDVLLRARYCTQTTLLRDLCFQKLCFVVVFECLVVCFIESSKR